MRVLFENFSQIYAALPYRMKKSRRGPVGRVRALPSQPVPQPAPAESGASSGGGTFGGARLATLLSQQRAGVGGDVGLASEDQPLAGLSISHYPHFETPGVGRREVA